MDIVDIAAAYIAEGRGFSINLADGTEPDDGYMVAVDMGELRVPSAEARRDVLTRFTSSREYTQSNLYLGGWFTGDSVCLDYSERFIDRVEAIEAGMARHQQAIWDIVADDEIEIDYSEWV